MSDIPRQVLSEHFQSRLSGRRLLAAVFTAFQFDAGFFESEILPVFFDSSFSHVPVIRLLQLEDYLRAWPGKLAVYYDGNGLVQSDDGSSKLDIRRIPVRLSTGIFHPKNILLLVEDKEPDDDGRHARHLLVAALSANLTRTGWWENVECCHIEEIEEHAATYLRDDLLDFFAILRKRSPKGIDHDALELVATFVRGTEQRAQRSSDGFLHPQFYSGAGGFDEFLEAAIGSRARDLCLEVISPYFDESGESAPLAALLRRFRPRETRVFLPRAPNGSALCPPALYDWVPEQGASWGRLSKDLLRTGASADARPRFVHAKVYRFFSSHPKREILVIGSVNLTTPAHQVGGNLESALVVEIELAQRPEFWLELDRTRPLEFVQPSSSDDGDLAIADSGPRVSIRFHWDVRRTEVYWDAKQPSGPLVVDANGVVLFATEPLPPQTWIDVSTAASESLAKVLTHSSFVTVSGDRSHSVGVLVQEEGMWKKPPLLSLLSVQDILHYWSLLTADQRNDFLQRRGSELLGDAAGNALVTKIRAEAHVDTIFSRFAGIFHAFECLEKSVDESLRDGNEKDALYRLFNEQHDSLGNLLRRVQEGAAHDDVDRYVVASCAKQLCRELRKKWPHIWSEHPEDARALETVVSTVLGVRDTIVAKNPTEMGPFLDWFDQWFQAKAKPLEVAS